MILSGTGIIDSQRGPALPAEFVIGGNSTPNSNRVLSTAVNDPQPWPTTTWTPSTGLGSLTYTLNDVVHNGTLWVGVGIRSSGTPRNSIIYSNNGVDWNYADIDTGINNVLIKVKWNGNKFLAISQNTATYWSSSDGINWIAELGLSSLMGVIYSITFHGGFWYVGGYNVGASAGIICRSTDGVSWSSVYSTTSGYILSLESNGSTLVAVVGSTPIIVYSTNGTSWSTATVASGAGTYQIASAIVWCGSPLNRFVLGGFTGQATSFKMLQSTNGISWTTVNTSSIFGSASNFSNAVNRLIWDGTYCWFTAQNSTTTWPGILFKTTNLTSFTAVLNRTQNSAGTTLQAIGFKS